MDAHQTEGQKSIAVIGSGMAGLVTAYLIRRDNKRQYDVQIYESVSLSPVDGQDYKQIFIISKWIVIVKYPAYE